MSADYQNILSRLPASILIVSSEGIVQFANDAATPILLHFQTQVGEPLNARGMQLLKKIPTPAIAEVVDVIEVGMILEVTVSMASEVPCLYLFFGRDVTRERELEQERLVLSRKETLAATLTTYAHEIGNPLAVALGYMTLPFEKLNLEKAGKVRLALERIRTVLEAIRSAQANDVTFEEYAGTDQMLQLKKKA